MAMNERNLTQTDQQVSALKERIAHQRTAGGDDG
jgi:hypothetical protein